MSTVFNLGQETAVHRILDANLDRAREGLRIIEDWCRFGLDHQELAAECKAMRQELAGFHLPEFRAARNTPGDMGTSLSHPREETRQDVTGILLANICRVEEALRVLEEYGKLSSPALGRGCKQMRYRVYALESELLDNRRHRQLKNARLYLVTSPQERILNTVEQALQGGLGLVQYRDKQEDFNEKLALARELCELCHRYDALFIVNDRPDLALAVNADGVHLGQQDAPIALARKLLGRDKIIGRSTTNPQELEDAIAEGADYVGVGPVYATPTKPNKAAAGLEYVAHASRNCPIPWYAIGGINTTNLREVLDADAHRVAVVRAIMETEQPTLATQYFLAELQRQQTLRRLPAIAQPAPVTTE